MRSASIALATLAAFALAAPGHASPPPDWSHVADVDTIQIQLTDAEGAKVDRTIWLVVHGGQGYIRAGGGSGWDANVDAVPDVTVRIGEVSYELRAMRIPEGPLYEAVMTSMRKKYGMQDVLLSPIRFFGGAPRILRLDARAGMPLP